MSSFGKRIRPAVDAELEAAGAQGALGDAQASFRHLERAHVLGQASTAQHVRVHVQMFLWALRHRVFREAGGQVVRIIGAATKTALGWVPTGNTGGANVSPFKPMPIPDDLRRVLTEAHAATKR